MEQLTNPMVGGVTLPDTAAAEDAFPDLPAEMLEGVASQQTLEAALQAVTESMLRRVDIAAVCFFGRPDGKGPLPAVPLILHGQLSPEVALPTADACQLATQKGRMQLSPAGENRFAVAVPVVGQDRLPDAVCAVVEEDAQTSPTRVGELLQLAATHITLWHTLQSVIEAEQHADYISGLLEILGKVESTDNLQSASLTLVNELQGFVGCQRVAVALSRRVGGPCRVMAISGYAKFDEHAPFAQAIQSAMDETLLLNQVVSWPTSTEMEGRQIRSLQHVCETMGARSVVGSPLIDEAGKSVGAWLFINPRTEDRQPRIEDLARATQRQVGTCLRLLQRSQPGPVQRALRSLVLQKGWVKKAAFGVAALLLFGALAVPGRYKVGCDCVVQPVVRRFVAAPYDGTLEETLVEPGEIVGQDDVLAKMDGREIRLELQGLEAERARAQMAWKKALSESNISPAQQEHVEMKRLDLQIQVLRRRQQNLQLRSPLAGIVVSGDLENSEGAPLKVGQTLFEIAPLDRMVVEVLIPEDDISHVAPGMKVMIRLDAFAGEKKEATIKSIVPRAEARDSQMVFVAKAELDNSDGLLRPGMNGRAKIIGPQRSLAWRLFHKPYESFMMAMGW